MVDFIPPLSDTRFNGLVSVIENALAGGAPAPSWVAVDDGTPGWIGLAAKRSLAERARGVLAASTEEALVVALQLGIGGAFRMPPSTLGVEAALVAAETAPVSEELSDPSFLAYLAARDENPIVISFKNSKFWCLQLGEALLVALLNDLARDLGVVFAIVSWPALVVADCEQQVVIDAWKELVTRKAIWTQGVEILQIETEDGGLLEGVYRELSSMEKTCEDHTARQPIHELPSGRLVGWWATGVGSVPTENWTAVPAIVGNRRVSWTLHSAHGQEIVSEVLTANELQLADETTALRVPGWATGDLRPGTPAGLLVARLAEIADRSKRPLWIPNVDAEGLRLVLSLPGVLWVDGPAVPR